MNISNIGFDDVSGGSLPTIQYIRVLDVPNIFDYTVCSRRDYHRLSANALAGLSDHKQDLLRSYFVQFRYLRPTCGYLDR
jgi:hypothetical protein